MSICNCQEYMNNQNQQLGTYGHRTKKARIPVRHS
ncbi:hypothetical protein Vi05172_g4827 [Venturia inaequalis]|nr:hypothetical protein Vi05172_g4827 [Venturia inaequalis]